MLTIYVLAYRAPVREVPFMQGHHPGTQKTYLPRSRGMGRVERVVQRESSARAKARRCKRAWGVQGEEGQEGGPMELTE